MMAPKLSHLPLLLVAMLAIASLGMAASAAAGAPDSRKLLSNGGNHNETYKRCYWNNKWYNSGYWRRCFGNHCDYEYYTCCDGEWHGSDSRLDDWKSECPGSYHEPEKCYWENKWYGSGEWAPCTSGHCQYDYCMCCNGKWSYCGHEINWEKQCPVYNWSG